MFETTGFQDYIVGFVLFCRLNRARLIIRHQKFLDKHGADEGRESASLIIQRTGVWSHHSKKTLVADIIVDSEPNAPLAVRYGDEGRGKSEPHFAKDADSPTRRWASLSGGGRSSYHERERAKSIKLAQATTSPRRTYLAGRIQIRTRVYSYSQDPLQLIHMKTIAGCRLLRIRNRGGERRHAAAT